MSAGRPRRRIVAYATVASILATAGVVVFWGQPGGWSAADAATRLPAVPAEVIAEYKLCHETPERCDPIPVGETESFRYAFGSVSSIQGWWAGSEASFSWEYGHLHADTCSLCMHGHVQQGLEWPSRFVMGNTDTETVTPYVRVLIPKLRDDQLHRRVLAFAQLSVKYPEKLSSTSFKDTSFSLRKDFNLFAVTPREMELLRQSVAKPVGTRGIVVIALMAVDLLGVITLIRMRPKQHRRGA